MDNRIYNPAGINYNIPKTVKTPEQQQLYKACVEFEAVLTKQMLASMQSSNDLFGKSFGSEYFKSMFQDELSKQIANNGLGLARMLYEQMMKVDPAKLRDSSHFSGNGRENGNNGE